MSLAIFLTVCAAIALVAQAIGSYGWYGWLGVAALCVRRDQLATGAEGHSNVAGSGQSGTAKGLGRALAGRRAARRLFIACAQLNLGAVTARKRHILHYAGRMLSAIYRYDTDNVW